VIRKKSNQKKGRGSALQKWWDKSRFRAFLVTLAVVWSLMNLVALGSSPGGGVRAEWQSDDSSTSLILGEEILWRFNYGADLAKPFFHPLSLPGLGELTWEASEDHPWHHALWFSWKYINEINYWEEDRDTGLSQGRTAWNKVERSLRKDHSARFKMQLVYHRPAEDPVLSEERIIEVSKPDNKGSYSIDWTGIFTAGNERVILDRTPIAGEDGATRAGGYAGLSVRFTKEMTAWRVIDSDGHIEKLTERIRIRARAVDYSGNIGHSSAGIAILDHPNNLNSPTPWYIIRIPRTPMAYFSPAVIHDQPHTMEPGEKMTLRYRIIVHPGHFDRDDLKNELEIFER
jgi:hypothetical protein